MIKFNSAVALTDIADLFIISSDVQGLVKPPRVKGKGQEGKGQGKDFMTLNKPLPFRRVRGFTGVLQGFLFL